jgi:glucosamine--fructose-6-phosphate aminotransferase (isomerizing)
MCGIIAYKGNRNASGLVLAGLKKLEYRGYDSWGIAFNKTKLNLIKEIGTINNTIIPTSNIAIGHTRWATHGKVNKTNAHPHLDCSETIAIVHNGIIENYQELKKELIVKSHKFKSDTDSEVIVHLIEEYYKNNDLITAIKLTTNKLIGSYALVILNENQLIAIKKESPLIIGKSNHGFFIASDIQSFLKHTNKIIYLEDGEIAIINDDLKIIKGDKEIKKKIKKLNLNPEESEKGEYIHFMLKEIFEQNDTIKKSIKDEKKIKELANEINNYLKIFFLGCGTAYYAGLTASYIFSDISKKQIITILGSEFNLYENFIDENTLIIPISQSGETADVLEPIKIAKNKGAKIFSIINSISSSLERISDNYILINAGPEIAVASTKAFTSQLSLLSLTAFTCINQFEEGKNKLIDITKKTKEILNEDFINEINKLSKKILTNNLFIIGKSSNYPIALESALKIKELSYIHAEGFASGELKHGTLALIEKGTPCLVIYSNNKTILNNAWEIKSRGGYIVGISPKYNEVFDYWIKIPNGGKLSPILNVIPSQLLAYYFAINKNLNPDRPRNLAKSVTVK